ncbi:SPOR domain-containing protein [Pseudotabrizicola algicola]|uniref:SPOR domain-containing protein n=1 Tax=Pseudotabrizicola algicola TaxID=2709381 RepID=A0A6B3RIR3_9RHOB|nr:SPOR domain-containing protein [Pseudotabrizicola algicola]NEX45301.1 SPOR domain-containing protein [Pseudotabrizicola algicola]
MAQAKIRSLILMTVASTALAACVNGENPFKGSDAAEGGQTRAASTSTRLVDRDVEAPEVFQTRDKALWDGRPSLGGVWVASPDAKDPERVIIRNIANGKFVIGALFRREIENPGPKLQISSDAAAALGILAGAPADVSVIALRREEEAVAPDATKPILDSSETVQTQSLDPVAGAAAALDRVDAKPVSPTPVAPVVSSGAAPASPAAASASAAPKPAAPAPAATDTGRTIQVGIFSVEANATRAVETLKRGGVAASVRREESQGKALWSVTTRGEASQLTKVKGLGFPDAYFLKR